MRKIKRVFYILLLLFAVAGMSRADLLEKIKNIIPQSQTIQNREQSAMSKTVSYVIDGDTFNCYINGEKVKVRMIGVDTPESVNETNPELNCEQGKIASNYTKENLSNRPVWLVYDKEPQDRYGRHLAYVYLDESLTDMYQEHLLRDGMAVCMKISPNTKYANHFAEIEQEAKTNNAGFWAEDFWN